MAQEYPGENNPPKIIIGSRSLATVIEMAKKAAPSGCTILITGESGTGKELVARTIHRHCGLPDAPFVPANVAAIPETLLETQLFGHERGAFTGAERANEGLFRAASGGTLFLDEISELPLTLQPKLLRALESKEILPVGRERPINVDVRIVSACSSDLKRMADDGEFRRDLYYRLNVVHLEIPPLRQRTEDIPLLTAYYLDHYCRNFATVDKAITPQALDLMVRYPWPGNVRELEHLIERMVVLGDGEIIDCDDLPPEILSFAEHEPPATLKGAVAQFKRDLIRRTLDAHDGNREQAARQLGISPATLYRCLEELGLHGYRRNGQEPDPDRFAATPEQISQV